MDGETSARRDAVDGDDDTGWAGQVARTRKARQRRGDTYRLREKSGFRGWWMVGSSITNKTVVVANGSLVSSFDGKQVRRAEPRRREYLVLGCRVGSGTLSVLEIDVDRSSVGGKVGKAEW